MVGVLLVLTVTQAVVANSVSTVGVDISTLQEEIKTYQKENALLKEELLTASSYTTIINEIEDKGFEPVKQQLTLTDVPPLAYR